MKITISAKNTELTKSIKDYVEKKIGRLERKIDSNVTADVVLSVEKFRHIADVKLNIDGDIIKATESSRDLYSSIDLVYEVLEKQIEKLKDKLYKSKRKAAQQEELIQTTTESRILTKDSDIEKEEQNIVILSKAQNA